MALFVDGEISSLEELAGHDSQLLDVASVEGIDVTRKAALAQSELALELKTILGSLDWVGQLFARPEDMLRRVVCTPALKMWHTFRTLELVYGDAYYSQLNDRYQAKRDQFHDKARWALERLIQAGLGLTGTPVPRAATPGVIAAPGTGVPDGTYYVTMAWMNSAGEEGASAMPACITTQASTLLVSPTSAPSTATGWNVYVGPAPDALCRQNSQPIGVRETWEQSSPARTDGPVAGSGQAASYTLPIPRMLQRG